MGGEPAHRSQEGVGAREVETNHGVDAAVLEAEMAKVAVTPPYPSFTKDNSEFIGSLLDYTKKGVSKPKSPRQFDDSATLNVGQHQS